jgi:hypothetical protein
MRWLLVVVVVLASCGAPRGPRCFQNSAPPPPRRDPAHALVDLGAKDRSPAACPLDRPAEGAACTVAAGDQCWYAHEGKPCDPDACTCKDGKFDCSEKVYIE